MVVTERLLTLWQRVDDRLNVGLHFCDELRCLGIVARVCADLFDLVVDVIERFRSRKYQVFDSGCLELGLFFASDVFVDACCGNNECWPKFGDRFEVWPKASQRG